MTDTATLTAEVMPKGTSAPTSVDRQTFEARRDARLKQAIEEDRKALKQGLVDKLKEARGMRTLERTFDSFDASRQPKAFRTCKDYLGKYQTGASLLLTGTYGTGKTHLATAIANALLDDGVPAMYDTWAGHLQRLKDEFANGERRHLSLMKKVDVLIIDDLGKDKLTEWNNEVLFEVINYRYEHRKPVVVTTNATPKELEDRCPAVYSRLCEICELIPMTGKDYRRK